MIPVQGQTVPILEAKPHTLLDLGNNLLNRLAHTLGYDTGETRAAARVFQCLAASWSSTRLGSVPSWPSDITDDHTPFEFSLAIDDFSSELRFLAEAQAERPSVRANWHAALALNRELRRDFDVDLGRLQAVQDLFEPGDDCTRFAMWHAVCLRRGSAPDFKVYLNPQARGRRNARQLLEAALGRLGLRDACAQLPVLGAGDELCYFSLDLSSAPDARVKLYVAHHQVTGPRIEAAVSTAAAYIPGRAAAFCGAMAASTGPFDARPVLTCLSFTAGNQRPTAATVHFPVRSYAPNDEVIETRVLRYLKRADSALYGKVLAAFARRALADRSGMQTYVSLRLLPDRERVTVYLAPEAFSGNVREPSRPPPRLAAPRDVGDAA